ncbi:MAG: hypothetical protein PVF50_11670 [Gammaproteobacteria bacterium]|jgi:hypothetical protein
MELVFIVGFEGFGTAQPIKPELGELSVAAGVEIPGLQSNVCIIYRG